MRPAAFPFEAFFEALRSAGLPVSVADRAAVTELLSQEADWDLELLRLRLMYTVAHDAEEQARFSAAFKRFFASTPRVTEAAPRAPLATTWSFVQFWPLALAVGIAVAAYLFAGNLVADLLSPEPPAPPTLTPPGPGVPPPPNSGAPPAPKLPVAPDPVVEVSVDTIPVPSWVLAVFALVLATPLAVGLAVVFRNRQRRLFPHLKGPFTFELSFPSLGLASSPLVTSRFEALARALGPTPDPTSRELDLARTSAATARQGGLIALAFREPTQAPRHLLLLQSDDRFEPLREHLKLLVEQLSARGVDLDLYLFTSSPDSVWRPGEPSRPTTLRALSSRFETIAVCGDPNSTLDASSLDQAPLLDNAWVSGLALFAARVWLCPSLSMQRSLGTKLLREAGTSSQRLELAALDLLTATTGSYAPERASTRPGWSLSASGSLEERVAAFYERELGFAFPLLCAATLLPDLSARGIAFLARRCCPELSWDDVARILGLPWVLEASWPQGLDHALRAVLHERFPELRDRASKEIVELLKAQAPTPGSGAELVHAVSALEHRHKTGDDVAAEFDALSRGPARLRSELRRARGFEPWLRERPLKRARLSLMRGTRFAGAASALTLGVTTAGTFAGESLLEGRLNPELDLAAVRAEVARLTKTRMLDCWSRHHANRESRTVSFSLVWSGTRLTRQGPFSLGAFDQCLNEALASIASTALPPRPLEFYERMTLPDLREPSPKPPPTGPEPVLTDTPIQGPPPGPSAAVVQQPRCLTKLWFTDIDRDGWGAGQASSACRTTAQGYSEAGGDCDDKDRSIFPGQTMYLPASVDLDCDGKVSPRWPAQKRGCQLVDGRCDSGPPGWVGDVPKCGEIGQLYTGCSPASGDDARSKVRCLEQSEPALQVCR